MEGVVPAFEGTPQEHAERALARKALRERFMPKRQRLMLRLIEIDTELKARSSWGAAVSALYEERGYVAASLADDLIE
jgi:hypothetical protein